MDADLLVQHFESGTTPLLRTDFSDDMLWQVVRNALAPDEGSDEDEWDLDPAYEPNIAPVADQRLAGATGAALAALLGERAYGYVLLADDRSMEEAASGGELTVVYVDLSVSPEDAEEFGSLQGREFRCVVGEVAGIEANLAIANMDFEEFADNVDADSVFRGFSG